MRTLFKSGALATGLAMFSMFFGAGNVIFPLLLGQYAKNYNVFAIAGMLLTAVVVPFTGLIAMILFEGDYKAFFFRLDKRLGGAFIYLIMAIIGPFVAMPRCISLAYSTMKISMPGANLAVFSGISCALIFIFSFKRSSILNVLGYILSPIMLISLVLMIVLGLKGYSWALPLDHYSLQIFWQGVNEGYNTLDLMGAFFFSTVIIASLKKSHHWDDQNFDHKHLVGMCLKSSLVAGTLLAVIYGGFSFVAANYANELSTVCPDRLLGAVANLILGPYAGFVANVAVSLACLTTAIALASVFASFLKREIFKGKVSYVSCLLVTIAVTFMMSLLGFSGIMKLIKPIIIICYPCFIVLAICNLFYKLYGTKTVQWPVLITLLLSAINYFWL
ncbi:MAG: branched-chain amino acid transport system II carrier protein [Chlamydiota bacterium]